MTRYRARAVAGGQAAHGTDVTAAGEQRDMERIAGLAPPSHAQKVALRQSLVVLRG